MAWRFNRIFWKMFAVIWLANSLVIVAMGYLMVHHRMQSQLEARHQQKVQSLAQFIIHRYEQQRLLAVNVARLKKRFELPRDFYLAIADAQGILAAAETANNYIGGNEQQSIVGITGSGQELILITHRWHNSSFRLD